MCKEFNTLLEQLARHSSLKTWSLIITFFGDSIVPRGGSVSAATVQSVMDEMGVSANAVRTAISRLAKDDWLERQKQGRYSFYRLSETGHAPFAKATARIYAEPGVKELATPISDPGSDTGYNYQRWLMAIKNPACKSTNNWNDLEKEHGGIRLTNNTVLIRYSTALVDQLSATEIALLPCQFDHIPDWLQQLPGFTVAATRYRDLQQRFKRLADRPPLEPITALAVRTLLIHEWRRLLLRQGDIPAELLPPDWPFDCCHRFVANLYQTLSPQAECWLNEFATGPNGPLGDAHGDINDRFR